MDPMIGAVLDGRYAITEQIGAGGMGTVYRAVQATVGRDVAVKVLSGEASEDDGIVQRFKNEARIISELRHPNTLKLIDFGHTPDARLYLVTEFLVGAPLDRVLRKGPLGTVRTLSVLRQVVESLVEAHAKGIVHRDLKPGNIFIEQVEDQEIVKVLDFGIARLSNQITQTRTGNVLGTPAYMSPEQSRGEKVDHRSDLYSLGIIAYECLSGTRPFEADTPLGVLFKHIHQKPEPIETHVGAGTLPAEFARLVMRLLEKHPDDRPASAGEIRKQLVEIERGLPASESAGVHEHSFAGSGVPDPLRAAHAPRTDDSRNWASGSVQVERRPLRRIGVLAAVLVLLIAAAASISLMRDERPEAESTARSLHPPPAETRSADPKGADRTGPASPATEAPVVPLGEPAGISAMPAAAPAFLPDSVHPLDSRSAGARIPEASPADARPVRSKKSPPGSRRADATTAIDRDRQKMTEKSAEVSASPPDAGVHSPPPPLAPSGPIPKHEVTTW